MKIDKVLLKDYENTELRRYDEGSFPNTVAFDELPELSVAGVLKANRYENGRLMQTYSKCENHVGVIAATRLGKTTSYVIPTLISFARQKLKRSLIISDPKGELYKNTSETLRREGYNVLLLNFRDYLHSECWNPITPIYRKYRRAMELENEVGLVDTEDGPRNVFRGTVYEDEGMLKRDIETMRDMLLEEVSSDVDSLATMFLPTLSKRDPYWEDSARELFKAYVWGMLEDSNKPPEKNGITEDTFSFSTIITLMTSMQDGNGTRYEDGGYFTDRGEDSRAYRLAKDCIIDNGSTTRKCIVSTFNSKVAVFKESVMRILTSCNTFEISELVSDTPTAIYIDYRDELKVHYKVISLFIQNAYTYLIECANQTETGKLDVPFYFVLDEFGNFPPIADFDAVVSACGGRNIFFILILQSYAQLENVYEPAVAAIIRDNLNVHVFFGSNNPDTLVKFSDECGMTARISPSSALNGNKTEIDVYQVETIPLVPKSALQKLQPGECIVTEANCGYVMFSKLERYFLCKEFDSLPKSRESDYKSKINPLDRKYSYARKRSGRKSGPYDFWN